MTRGPASMPYTRADRIVMRVLFSRTVDRAWRTIGCPTIAVRMPNRRLPSGGRGFRVLTKRIRGS